MRKMHILMGIVILWVAGHASEPPDSLQELDSVGRMPEITVTAPKYENQDEAWLGMVEGIVVEARRPSDGRNETITGEVSIGMVGEDPLPENSGSWAVPSKNSVYLLASLTLILAILSNLFRSSSMYLSAEEEDQNGTKY